MPFCSKEVNLPPVQATLLMAPSIQEEQVQLGEWESSGRRRGSVDTRRGGGGGGRDIILVGSIRAAFRATINKGFNVGHDQKNLVELPFKLLSNLLVRILNRPCNQHSYKIKSEERSFGLEPFHIFSRAICLIKYLAT